MSENVSVPSGHNLPEYTVSELASALKRTIEDTFGIVRVRGEISGFKRHGSGHSYFSLKDENAVLDAVVWRGTVGRLALAPEDGMEVVCTGRLTTYAARSRYQLVVEQMELAGEGALLKLIEERKRRLEAEGLFDPARKKKLPFLPQVIGVVTSPTGAVIRDILHRLRDRFPVHVLLWPAAVQGEGAALQVASAIRGFNALPAGGRVPRPDVLIVARGGGSLEDLMSFNDEAVVRAAAASQIPLISAVGHEIDTTLIDFAADVRAPTPTAAAEMAVPVRADLIAQVRDKALRLDGAVRRFVQYRRTRLEGLARGLPDPRGLLDEARRRTDDADERLANAVRSFLRERRFALERLADPRLALDRLVREKRAAMREVGGRLRPETLRADLRRHRRDLAKLVERLVRALLRYLEERRRVLASFGQILRSYSYEEVLKRGFAVVRREGGRPVTAAAEAPRGGHVAIEFHDGRVGATLDGRSAEGGRRPRTRGTTDNRQRDLLEEG